MLDEVFMLTQEYLKSILNYNPETGIFTYLYRPNARKCWNSRCANKPAGIKGNHGYIAISIQNKKYLAHRLAVIYLGMDLSNGSEVDHINGRRDDNRKSNLRVVNSQGNSKNMKRSSNNTSGRTGVYWDKINSKWLVMAHSGNKQHYAGRFKNKDDAIKAREDLELKLGFHKNHDRH